MIAVFTTELIMVYQKERSPPPQTLIFVWQTLNRACQWIYNV